MCIGRYRVLVAHQKVSEFNQLQGVNGSVLAVVDSSGWMEQGLHRWRVETVTTRLTASCFESACLYHTSHDMGGRGSVQTRSASVPRLNQSGRECTPSRS